MAVEALRQVFKTLADPTRMRLLALLERNELAVHELMQVLGMAQSTVSRHLGILRDAGLVQDRREGTFAYYRRRIPAEPRVAEVWALAKETLVGDPVAEADAVALAAIMEARALRTRNWFDAVGPEWDALRAVFNDDTQRARAIGQLVPRELRVADIGTGTGILASELARLGLRVIAVDNSVRMLEAARAKFGASDLPVEFRHGDASALPLADGEVHAAFAHMVLHYVASPADVVAEMARVVAPGGRVVVVDFVHHDRDWMKDKLGVQWQGFSLDTMQSWFEQAGLEGVHTELSPPAARSEHLPATFIATALRPAAGPVHRRADTHPIQRAVRR